MEMDKEDTRRSNLNSKYPSINLALKYPDSLRPSLYVAFLPCRIQFDRNSTSESAAAFPAAHSTGFVALFDRNATPIQASNFCRVESNSDIMLMH